MQVYSNPEREQLEYALPDVEVFFVDASTASVTDHDGNPLPRGWYWWSCFPGCMPDGDPNGPFKTQASAKRDAQQLD